MAVRYPSGTGSIVAIAGHPLHPMVVPIPIGALILALAADIGFWITQNPFWTSAATWLLLATLVSGAVAAVLGVIELMGLGRARTLGIGLAHGAGNILLLALTLWNYRLHLGTPEQAYPYGLIISAVAVVLVMLTGWLGGEMSFRHGVGVSRRIGAGEGGDSDYLPSGREDIGKS